MTTQANTYTVLVGPHSFLRPDFDVSRFYPNNSNDHLSETYRFRAEEPYELRDVAGDFHARLQDPEAFEVMNPGRCLQAYSEQYPSWGDLFLELSPVLGYCTENCLQVCNGSCFSQHTRWALEWNDEAMIWSSMTKKLDPDSKDEAVIWPSRSYNVDLDWNDETMIWSSRSNKLSPKSSLLDSSGSAPFLLALGNPSSYPSYEWTDHVFLPMKEYFDRNNETQIVTWSALSGHIVNCRAERVPENCTLNFNLSFALVVIACNLIKFITMSLTLWRYREPTLVTTGDAIDSFLARPDETTAGLCLFSAAAMYLKWECPVGGPEKSPEWRKFRQKRLDDLMSPVYKPEICFWGQSASSMRWIMCFILYSSQIPPCLTIDNTLQIPPYLRSWLYMLLPEYRIWSQLDPRHRRSGR